MEKGTATARITLHKGIIEVHHGKTGDRLFRGYAKAGAWDRILKAIIRNCENPSGPMAEIVSRKAAGVVPFQKRKEA